MLLALGEPEERFTFRLAWSEFRRRHQAIARRCHAARRAGSQDLLPGSPTVPELRSGTFVLTDEHWARLAPVLPPVKPPTGRPANDHRPILAGIFWMIRTGASWRDLPEEFGRWQTVHTRYQRWKKTGIWQRILDALQQPETAS